MSTKSAFFMLGVGSFWTLRKEHRTFLGCHIYSLSPLLFWVSLVRRGLLPELAGWASGQVALLQHRDAWASSGQEWYACVTELLQEGFKRATEFKEALLDVAAKS